jgi:hypothetical protein
VAAITKEVIRDAIINRTPLAKVYTSTAIAVTSITDSQVLKGPHPSSLVPRGSPIRVRDVSDPTNAFEDTFADVYNPATGNVTFEPDLDSITPATPDIGEIWIPEIGAVSYVDDDINLALTVDCGAWVPFVLTLVTDGDMETPTADVATYWTGSGAGTKSKVDITGFPHRFARQALRFANAAAGEYVYPGSINVVPGDTYYVNVLARALVSTTALTMRDVTNGANITLEATATDTTQKQWVMLYSTFTVPSGCYQIRPHLGGVLITADVYWACLYLVRLGDTRISLPARITQMNRIGRVYQRMGGDIDEFYRGEDLEYDIEQVQGGYDLILSRGVLGGLWPVYAEEWQNYTSLASDIATTTCDLDYVTAHTCRRIFQRLYDAEEKNRQPATSAGAWVNRWSGLLKQWRAEAVAMDTKYRGGGRPRLRFPQLATSQVVI